MFSSKLHHSISSCVESEFCWLVTLLLVCSINAVSVINLQQKDASQHPISQDHSDRGHQASDRLSSSKNYNGNITVTSKLSSPSFRPSHYVSSALLVENISRETNDSKTSNSMKYGSLVGEISRNGHVNYESTVRHEKVAKRRDARSEILFGERVSVDVLSNQSSLPECPNITKSSRFKCGKILDKQFCACYRQVFSKWLNTTIFDDDKPKCCARMEIKLCVEHLIRQYEKRERDCKDRSAKESKRYADWVVHPKELLCREYRKAEQCKQGLINITSIAIMVIVGVLVIIACVGFAGYACYRRYSE